MPSRTWSFLSFLFGMAAVVACGEESANTGDPNAPGSTPTAPPGDAPDPNAPDPKKIDEAPIAMSQLLAGFDWSTGYWQPSKKRVFSLGSTVSASMARVTVARVEGTNVEVSTLPVKGKVPTGRVEAMTYAESIDRFVLVVRAVNPHRVEVVTLALGDAEATFETLTQSPAQATDGYMFGPIYPKGGSSFLVVRGNDLYSLTLSGAQATWSDKAPASGFYRGNSTTIVLDAKRNRLIAYGEDVYDFATKKSHYEPTIATMSLGGPYSWTDLTIANVPPAEKLGVSPNWAALDGLSPRILAIVPIKGMCGLMECVQSSLWSANLQQGSWTKLRDHYNPPTMYKPWATDADGRRIFSHADGKLGVLPIDDASKLEQSPVVQKGDLGPTFSSTTVFLEDGKLLSTDGGSFRVFDPSGASLRWETFGKVRMPQLGPRPSLTEDPKTGEVLVFGSAPTTASKTSSALYILAKDGSTITEQTSISPPPARVAHGSAFVGRALVIVGGGANESAGTYLDDAWSFDRDKGAWAKIATLPRGLGSVTLRPPTKGSSSTEVLAIGWNAEKIAPVVAIDVASGKARELAANGEAPAKLWSIAPLGSCFVGFESGDTVDMTEPKLWRCKRAGDDEVRWEKTPLDAHDEAIGGYPTLGGAGSPDGTKAYFVGRTMWSVSAKM